MKQTQAQIIEYKKNYYLKNKDKFIKAFLKWKSNPDNEKKHREWDKRYQKLKREKFPKQKLQQTKEYYELNPEIYKAHKLFQKALRNGKIIKKPCEICKEENSQGHHPDYNKPLEVVWLCPSHHKKVDMGLIKLK